MNQNEQHGILIGIWGLYKQAKKHSVNPQKILDLLRPTVY